jgi:predicted MFS family arabinose efflux permease
MVLPAGFAGTRVNMPPKGQFRAVCYAIEGINSFAVAFYFNYLFFFFHDRFGFGDRQNLLLAAGTGVVYTVASWQAGRFAQRCGCFTALKVGFGILIAGFTLALLTSSLGAKIASACLVNGGLCFVWPSLEALISEGDTPDHLPHAIGLYNITWAVTYALAFFVGGSIIKQLGYAGLFGLPLAFMVLQLAMTYWLEKLPRGPQLDTPVPPPPAARLLPAAPDRDRNFQRMAWLANPAAYVAINTLMAVLPGVATKFHISTTLAGYTLSLWCFARCFAFVVLWRWTGWHYRFGWLASAFGLLILSFAAILVAPSLVVVILAQIIFGMAIGLIYYSSLFYAMDASDTKGEHGGIHEAAIGVGNCLGPAMGATALWLAPAYPSMGAWAVSGFLSLGFGGLCWLRQHPPAPNESHPPAPASPAN